jgi:opacity protein-like surface antigen
MKNALFAIALATAGIAAVPATSHAADTSGFFINGNAGQSNLNKGAYDDSDTGYSANVGYRWAVAPNVLIGVEGGYTDLGSISGKVTDLGGGVTGRADDISISGWNIGANGHFNVSDNWYVSGRLGLFRGKTEFKVPSLGNVDDTSSKWYAGAGFGYDFNNNFSVGLNYDYYRTDFGGTTFSPNLVSLSGEYRF